ncbi:hypothetical protein BGZ94_001617 [Podila epigama]|nr:hypothetical protein BGZ94_001617 [Podila epigama]
MADIWNSSMNDTRELNHLLYKMNTICTSTESCMDSYDYYLPDTTEDTTEACSDEVLFGIKCPLPFPSSMSSQGDDDSDDTDENKGDKEGVLEIPSEYMSLWEIQLELGEIPDMISNNLLKSCRDCFTLRQQCDSQSCTPFDRFPPTSSHTRWLDIETGADEYEDDYVHTETEVDADADADAQASVEAGDDESDDDCESSACGSYSSQSRYWGEHSTGRRYAVYGSCDNDDDVFQNDIRHDRKDSGVFVHNES